MGSGLPFLPSGVLTPGTKPISRGLDGPRLDASPTVMLSVADEVTASEGRLWKYLGIGLPFLSVNGWPISDEPTSLPCCWTKEPLAWWPKAASPMPTISSE